MWTRGRREIDGRIFRPPKYHSLVPYFNIFNGVAIGDPHYSRWLGKFWGAQTGDLYRGEETVVFLHGHRYFWLVNSVDYILK